MMTNEGKANVKGATDLEGKTDGKRPNWFIQMLEAIAEFFVELFTDKDYITSAEKDADLGRQLAEKHPESLRAILSMPGGEKALRAHLEAQCPKGTTAEEWKRTVNDVIMAICAGAAGTGSKPCQPCLSTIHSWTSASSDTFTARNGAPGVGMSCA